MYTFKKNLYRSKKKSQKAPRGGGGPLLLVPRKEKLGPAPLVFCIKKQRKGSTTEKGEH